MGTQSEVAAHIERLNFALVASKEKFDRAMDNGHEFRELKKMHKEIKDLEKEIQEYRNQQNGS